MGVVRLPINLLVLLCRGELAVTIPVPAAVVRSTRSATGRKSPPHKRELKASTGQGQAIAPTMDGLGQPMHAEAEDWARTSHRARTSHCPYYGRAWPADARGSRGLGEDKPQGKDKP